MKSPVVGNRIREFAIARGCCNASVFARRSGVPKRTAIYLWQRQWMRPHKRTIERICGAFEANKDEFLIYAKGLERCTK